VIKRGKEEEKIAEGIGQYMSKCIFLESKRKGRGVDHPPKSKVEIKERVELYLPLFPNWDSGSSWPDTP
jgi:hypothetical protein